MFTAQVGAVPAQAPVQPAKRLSGSGDALSVTIVPAAYGEKTQVASGPARLSHEAPAGASAVTRPRPAGPPVTFVTIWKPSSGTRSLETTTSSITQPSKSSLAPSDMNSNNSRTTSPS